MRDGLRTSQGDALFPARLLRETGLLIAAAEYAWEHTEGAEGALAWMRRMESGLDEEPWKDGKHSGDCTKTAHTCSRCFIESYERKAAEMLKSDDFGFSEDDFPEWST